jgi:3-hydroxyisobutyrate dehydrogenase-like beta-hydroxyacid dehydrogenase
VRRRSRSLKGLDLDAALLIEAISQGSLDSPYFRLKSKAITERRFDPQFKLKLAAKDAQLMEEAARRHPGDASRHRPRSLASLPRLSAL